MKKNHTMREVLLLTTSTFARQDLCENERASANAEDSTAEKLEKACWNGMLDGMLGIPVSNGRNGERLFLWKVSLGARFLCAEFSYSPFPADGIHSVDPYLFLPLKNNN